MSTLARFPHELLSASRVRLDEYASRILAECLASSNENVYVEFLIEEWESGKSQRPLTWRSLLNVLQELGLGELSLELEKYMQSE